MVMCLLLALSGRAATQTNTFDWQFSNFGSTNIPPTTAVDPAGGTPEAAVFGAPATYYHLTGPLGPTGPFGSPTGLWDIGGSGQLQLTLDRTSASPVDYTVVITLFAAVLDVLWCDIPSTPAAPPL